MTWYKLYISEEKEQIKKINQVPSSRQQNAMIITGLVVPLGTKFANECVRNPSVT